MKVELVKDLSTLKEIIDNEVFNETYKIFEDKRDVICLLVKVKNEEFKVATLSFTMEDPDRIFSVSFSGGRYSLEMKIDEPFRYEGLNKEEAFNSLSKLQKRQAI